MSKNDTPLHEMTKAQLRKVYVEALRGLTYDNASKAQVGAALSKLVDMSDAAPVEIVRAIRKLTVPCRRCAATGAFITYVENGVPRGPGGSCFRCGGKGHQDHKDGHRNRAHDIHYINRSAT